VLFVINIDILTSGETGKIWVTKLNPVKWKGKSNEERWFISKDDIKTNFSYGTFDQMILFRHCGGELKIRKHLNRIILNDPHMTWTVGNLIELDSFCMAYGALNHAMPLGGLSVEIEKRKCRSKCECNTQYKNDRDFVQKMFFPELMNI
jgi:hypothetical protein